MSRAALLAGVFLAALASAAAAKAPAGPTHPAKPAAAQPAAAPATSILPKGVTGLGESGGKKVGIVAEQGVEWQQNNHVYIARGHVKATRGDETLTCDTLYAYYRPTQAKGASPTPQLRGNDAKAKGADALDGGNSSATEIYKIEADGQVHFTTPTQSATGDHAIYDLDKAVLVLTGKDLQMVTPSDTITARDSLEWYDHQQLGVARGNAIAVRTQKRVRADVLTAQVEKTATQASHISHISATGNVVLTSPDQIARGDVGYYNVDTGIATLSGHVRLTRGNNELRGQYAVVDLNRNISRLLNAPPNARVTAGHRPQRVHGLLIPQNHASTASR